MIFTDRRPCSLLSCLLFLTLFTRSVECAQYCKKGQVPEQQNACALEDRQDRAGESRLAAQGDCRSRTTKDGPHRPQLSGGPERVRKSEA